MAVSNNSFIIETAQLQDRRKDPGLCIVDLSKRKNHIKGHIPGALYLDYSALVSGDKTAPGRWPGDSRITGLVRALGLTPDTHVVALDDEGGGRAGRLLWTLDVIGHTNWSLLNGGMYAWVNEGYSVTTEDAEIPAVSDYPEAHIVRGFADREYVLSHLDDSDVVLLDARTPKEFDGRKQYAARAGHIPGAVNLDWLDTMDMRRNARLLPDGQLSSLLAERGVVPEREVVVYCQTHHRSAHSYVVLRHLGYPRVRGYAGAWSEWGNDPDVPVEL
ncbi:MAG: sulfurtransferase [Gammaproteobacteria bacterium]|nr:sulfurtransferase [Gammaproteobacteria bacterium]